MTDLPPSSLPGLRPPKDAVDQAVVEGLRDLGRAANRDVLGELAALFLDGAGRRLNEMRAALAAGDAGPLESAAHSLRGSAGHLGLIALAGLCELVERKAQAGHTSGCAPTIESLRVELERVTPWLESLRPKAEGQ